MIQLSSQILPLALHVTTRRTPRHVQGPEQKTTEYTPLFLKRILSADWSLLSWHWTIASGSLPQPPHHLQPPKRSKTPTRSTLCIGAMKRQKQTKQQHLSFSFTLRRQNPSFESLSPGGKRVRGKGGREDAHPRILVTMDGWRQSWWEFLKANE